MNKYSQTGSITINFARCPFTFRPVVINEWKKNKTLNVKWFSFDIRIWCNWTKEWN